MWLVYNKKVMSFVTNWIEFLKLRGLASKNDTFHTDIEINNVHKIGVNVGICLRNNLDNFQLHRLTVRENIAKIFMGLLFWLTL